MMAGRGVDLDKALAHSCPMAKLIALALLAAAALPLSARAQTPAPAPGIPLPKLPAASPASASAAGADQKEEPLLPPSPKEMGKEARLGAKACEPVSDAWSAWLREGVVLVEGQTLRPGPKDRAREGAAALWEGFRRAREAGFDVDAFGQKVEAAYLGAHWAGAFAPQTPFERFKEPRRPCAKKGPPAAPKPAA